MDYLRFIRWRSPKFPGKLWFRGDSTAYRLLGFWMRRSPEVIEDMIIIAKGLQKPRLGDPKIS